MDLIVVMDPGQRRLICERFGRLPRDVVVLGDFDPTAVDTRTIRDPVDQKREVFDAIRELMTPAEPQRRQIGFHSHE